VEIANAELVHGISLQLVTIQLLLMYLS